MSRRTMIRYALVAAVLVAGFVGYRAASGGGTEFKAKFEATIGLYPGSEVQVLGVRVGTVTAVEPTGDSVTVSMRLNKGENIAADTNAVIVAPTMVSDRFVQLTEPYVGGEKLKAGAVLATERTAVPVEIDDLYSSLIDASEKLGPNGANKNGALSDLLEVAAKNLDGQGADINKMIAEFGKATGTLSDTGDDFFATLANFKEFNDMLVTNDRGVANVNRQFAAVTDYLAEDRQDLAEAVANLGDALSIVDDFIDDNRGNLKTSVENLLGPTQVLVKQKDSLEEAVRTIPLVLQNYLKAYNPKTNTLDGRGNLNEVSIWANDGLSAQTSKKAPPVLLPGVGGNE
ncbi:MCE family protein [Aeromicrobium sp. P5_D10]